MAASKDNTKGKSYQSDIIPCGEALNVVAGWLGLSAEQALQEAAENPDEAKVRRPPLLGLGAKYLPHHKTLEIAGALDSRLKRRITAAAENTDASTSQYTKGARKQGPVPGFMKYRTSVMDASAQGQRVGLRRGETPAGGASRDEEDEDEEEEGPGRAGVFISKVPKTVQQSPGAGTTADVPKEKRVSKSKGMSGVIASSSEAATGAEQSHPSQSTEGAGFRIQGTGSKSQSKSVLVTQALYAGSEGNVPLNGKHTVSKKRGTQAQQKLGGSTWHNGIRKEK